MSQPFARAIAMMAAIQAAMRLPTGERELRLRSIGEYQSRGKGKGRSKPGRIYLKSRSKYEPHQGAREIARRLRNAEKLARSV